MTGVGNFFIIKKVNWDLIRKSFLALIFKGNKLKVSPKYFEKFLIKLELIIFRRSKKFYNVSFLFFLKTYFVFVYLFA